ncbi:TPA: filamentous hemagglutinin N-terminal domain-containing protein, partial [Campylobacter lari]|nr:filamentous hemagglutinin N-terminal domain-containing protein [Campylobacter lari]
FSIGKGESVNFEGSNKNYLNIAHGTDKSTIEGVLNAGGNNVFLINPNGVIITKTGTINANRFVASTSSMSDDDMWKFAKLTKEQGAAFSPVFKPQKAGNVVNMGNINANDVLLIGNKVSIDGGHINGKHNDNVSGDALKNPSGNTAEKIHLAGNEVNILVDGIKSDSIIASAYVKGSLQQSTTSYYNYGNNIGKLNFITQEYDNIDKTNLGNKKLVTKDKFEKHATIGSDVDWWHFAKGWNENKNNMRDFFSTYKLVDDIDFGGNCKNGVCTGQNYANYWVDLNSDGIKQDNEFTNMIVAHDSAFNKNFDGQGFTLKNINIDATGMEDVRYLGIFGFIQGAEFDGNIVNIGNVNIDYMGGSIKGGMYSSAGGLCSWCADGNFYNITISNIENIIADEVAGGFAGKIDYSRYISIDNISIDNIKNIVSMGNAGAGGFTGYFLAGPIGELNNITLKRIGNVKSSEGDSGGFIGTIDGGMINANNISIEILGEIFGGSSAGGFVGTIGSSEEKYNFSNIYIYFGDASDMNVGHTWSDGNNIGIFFGRTFDNGIPTILEFENIYIYHHKDKLTHAVYDQNYWNKYNFIKYNDSTQSDAYKDFLSKANTIEKPSKPSKPTDPIDPADPDVILDDDDLYANVIMEWIINEIRGVEHTVSVEDLKKLADFINAFKGLDKDSSEAEIKAVVKTHLGIDGDKALSIAQSISFLLNYQEHNFDGRLSEKAKTIYDDIIKPNVSNTLGLISYLDKNQAYLLEQYNKYKELEQIFKDKEQAYFTAEAEFNRLLDLVNKGKLSYNDPKFTQAFDNWLNAYNSYNALSNDISDLNANVASINKGIENLGYTKFSFAKFDDITKIHLVEPKLPDIDNSQGGDLPDFEQTASLNLIGDEAVSDDEETEEVEEAS